MEVDSKANVTYINLDAYRISSCTVSSFHCVEIKHISERKSLPQRNTLKYK